MSILPTVKQSDSVIVSVQNGDETFSFDLDYFLGFGIYTKDATDKLNDDKYLALGVSASHEQGSAEVYDALLLRMLDVMVKAYDASGLTLRHMEEQIRTNWMIAAARNIREKNPGMSSQDAFEELARELTKR